MKYPVEARHVGGPQVLAQRVGILRAVSKNE
jgi:hypothetical protein